MSSMGLILQRKHISSTPFQATADVLKLKMPLEVHDYIDSKSQGITFTVYLKNTSLYCLFYFCFTEFVSCLNCS